MNHREYSVVVHEAAHCVASFFLCSEPRGAVVFDTGGGLCMPNPSEGKPEMLATTPDAKLGALLYGRRNVTARDLLNECIMFASGHVSGEILMGLSSQRLYDDNGDGRMIEANFRGCFPDATDEETCAFLSLVHTMTRPVIRKFEKQIWAVADKLAESKIISADEVIKTIFPSVQIT